jgi:hypothetical protein
MNIYLSKSEIDSLVSLKAPADHFSIHPEIDLDPTSAVTNTVNQFIDKSIGNVNTDIVGGRLKFKITSLTGSAITNVVKVKNVNDNTSSTFINSSNNLEIEMNDSIVNSPLDSITLTNGTDNLVITKDGITSSMNFNIIKATLRDSAISYSFNDVHLYKMGVFNPLKIIPIMNDLHFNSDATFYQPLFASSFNTISSKEFKNSISEFKESALDILRKVNIISFNYLNENDSESHLGVIAENEDTVISGVNQDKIDLPNMVGLIVKAIQELKERQNLINSLQGA